MTASSHVQPPLLAQAHVPPSSTPRESVRELEQRYPGLWRAGQLGRAGRLPVCPTGYDALTSELPGGGWPAGAVTELLLTQDGVGEIVRPATGTDRAVYAPIDRPIILPPFLGTWAVRSGKCIGQSYRDRMELHTDLAIVAGEAFTVQGTYVDAGPPHDRAGDEPLRSADYSNTRDMLVGLVRSGEEDTRFVHFRFSDRSGKLLVEEVGKPRRAFVRCAI